MLILIPCACHTIGFSEKPCELTCFAGPNPSMFQRCFQQEGSFHMDNHMLYFFPMPVASPLLQDKPILNADCLPRAQYYRPNHSLSCTDCCVWRSVPYVSCVCTACRGLLRLSSSLGSWYEQARIVQVFSQSTDKILTLRKNRLPFPHSRRRFLVLAALHHLHGQLCGLVTFTAKILEPLRSRLPPHPPPRAL